MAILTLLIIMVIWMIYLRNKRMHWSAAMVMVLTVYFLMSTTIHPWYLGTLFVLSIISGHRYPLLWTYLVFLSYSHYQEGCFSEKYLFIWLEYFLLFGWMLIEFRRDYFSGMLTLNKDKKKPSL
jgi:alpha-1,6-mannosyltransferase